MRLIDADALCLGKFQNCGMTDYKMGWNEALEAAAIHAPTVEAAPVVHGQWIVCGDGEYVPFMCSACGKTSSWYHAQTAKYCPNCGAKMDKEVNSDD